MQKKIRLIDVRRCINQYHCEYGWAPTMEDLTTILDAENWMQIRSLLNIYKQSNCIRSNGERTLSTHELQYNDDRESEYVTEIRQMMSKSERKIYRYLVSYIIQMNYAPTKREIAEYMGYNPESSQSCIRRKLKKLEKIGAVKLGPKNTNRTIHVVGVNAHVQYIK